MDNLTSTKDLYCSETLEGIEKHVKDVATVEPCIPECINKEAPLYRESIAHEIYRNVRASEEKNRPSTNYTDIKTRLIFIDWLTSIAEIGNFRIEPETLFLTVNYIDRYLSGNSINQNQWMLVGFACLMIAVKYEERGRSLKEFYKVIYRYKYHEKDQILQHEFAVARYLNFNFKVATPVFFLRQYVHAAQRMNQEESMEFQYMANCILEYSLLPAKMFEFAPSITAASAAFLAKFILSPQKQPWDSIWRDITEYQPEQLEICVKVLLVIYRATDRAPDLQTSIKYARENYLCVSKNICPQHIPEVFFEDVNSDDDVASSPKRKRIDYSRSA